MAPAWLIPALKAVVPHLASIVSAGVPAFASKTVDAQIAELQKAAAQNAENIRELAEQLQKTIAAVDEAARAAERRLRVVLWFGAGALIVAAVSLGVAVATLYWNPI